MFFCSPTWLEAKELQTSLISSPNNPTVRQVSGSVWRDFIRFEPIDNNGSSPRQVSVFGRLVKGVLIAVVESNNQVADNTKDQSCGDCVPPGSVHQ